MKLSRLLLILGLGALLIALAAGFGRLSELASLVRQARWPVLFGMLATQAASYWANAHYYRSVLRIFGHEVEFRRLVQASLGITFVNQAFPSGGASGAVYLSSVLKGEVSVGKATLAQIFRYIFTFLSFLGVLVVGFLMLFFAGDVSRLTVRFTLLLLLAIIVGCFIALTLVSDRAKLERMAGAIIIVINAFNRHILRRRQKLITVEGRQHFFDEFYLGYRVLSEDRWAWRRPLLFCMLGSLAEVATVYVVAVAFGAVINPGVVIAAYTLANIASLISFLTNGVGSYEAAMIAIFAALGVPVVAAATITLVYRALNFAVLMPVGFHYYRKSL